jgi:hypothetical protein
VSGNAKNLYRTCSKHLDFLVLSTWCRDDVPFRDAPLELACPAEPETGPSVWVQLAGVRFLPARDG